MGGDDGTTLLRSAVDPAVAVDGAEVARVVEELFPEALGVWVYGSFADGTARRDSDVDVAILAERPVRLGWDAMDQIGELASRLGRDVDLVDLRSVPPALRFEVLSNGVRVAAKEALACDRFETSTVSAYQRLNVERREVIEAIRERGTVY